VRTPYFRRCVNLEKIDYWIVQSLARENGLGSKGFSAALRIIIRQWHATKEALLLQNQLPPASTSDSDCP
jgi:hypothetical protein